MTAIRAKFQCNEITIRPGSAANPAYNAIREEVVVAAVEGQELSGELDRRIRELAKERGVEEWISFDMPTVKLNPVYAPDDPTSENYKFWSASPSGELTMTIANPDAAEYFELRKQYYLTFEAAE